MALTPEEWSKRREEIGAVGQAAQEGMVLLENPLPGHPSP
ncbi:hypothetical protein TCCBUS3UF1_10300 [Thermus sp. CCB_US3_UF1]|nr:hypothetical protein TCCBUS3UF1_10300 [Thermus sp. CCB_US3_UF1]